MKNIERIHGCSEGACAEGWYVKGECWGQDEIDADDHLWGNLKGAAQRRRALLRHCNSKLIYSIYTDDKCQFTKKLNFTLK